MFADEMSCQLFHKAMPSSFLVQMHDDSERWSMIISLRLAAWVFHPALKTLVRMHRPFHQLAICVSVSCGSPIVLCLFSTAKNIH